MLIGLFLMIAALVAVDQLFKYLVVVYLKPIGTFPIFENVFHLTYVENFGAVGGILRGKNTLLIVVTSIFLLGILILLVLKKIPGRFLPWMFALIAAGGIGNLVDRIFRGFVVDYLDFRLIHYPVFNFADCCVVVGVFAVVFYAIFHGLGKSESNPSGGDTNE